MLKFIIFALLIFLVVKFRKKIMNKFGVGSAASRTSGILTV